MKLDAKILNAKATQIFKKLIEGATEDGYAKYGKDGGAFMPAVVELVDWHVGIVGIGSTAVRRIWSIAHYYESFGDLCQDPEMTFFETALLPNQIFPMTFQQANPVVYTEGIVVRHGAFEVNRQQQAQITEFANTWLVNIDEQQAVLA